MQIRSAISRRQLLGRALWVAGGMAATLPHTAMARAAAPLRTLFDPRFARARAAVQRLASAGARQPVRGDATELALWLSRQPLRAKAPLLQGITTASIPFCLSQMNPRRTLHLERLDRDLCYWRI